jgi:HSP20 family molecular chaperone IbpA
VEARYTDGVLQLTLPKAEEAKPRQISVNAS